MTTYTYNQNEKVEISWTHNEGSGPICTNDNENFIRLEF